MQASRYNLIFDAPQTERWLLLNPLSGAADLIDGQALSLLRDPGRPGLEQAFPDVFRRCRERGYLYESPEAEAEAFEAGRRRSLALYRAQPFRAHVYLTFLCNLRCTYCFQRHSFHQRGAAMQPDVIDALFEAIAELAQRWGSPDTPILTLFGGEPLLRRRSQLESVARILDGSAKRGYQIRIVTNGVDLASYVDLLAEHPPEFIQVTLDGPRAVHDQRRVFADGRGSFDDVVAGVDASVARGLHVALRVNIDPRTVVALPELAEFIRGKGWLDAGVNVGITPVDEFVPESEWCAEHARAETLKAVLDLVRQHPETRFMKISYRLAQFFEHVVDHGSLPTASSKYCPAVIGNQASFDHEGKIFACC